MSGCFWLRMPTVAAGEDRHLRSNLEVIFVNRFYFLLQNIFTFNVLFKINVFHKLLYLKSLFYNCCSWRRITSWIIEIGNRYFEGGFREADEGNERDERGFLETDEGNERANERDEEANERIISSERRLKRYVGRVINFKRIKNDKFRNCDKKLLFY